jgi:hypothetical protein
MAYVHTCITRIYVLWHMYIHALHVYMYYGTCTYMHYMYICIMVCAAAHVLEVCYEQVHTLIFIMIDFFFPTKKKTRDSIPDLKCTGSSFVLSVSVKKSTNTRFFTLKKSLSL